MTAVLSRFGLFRKRTLWLPTWRFWVPVLVGCLGLSGLAFWKLHSFLAVTEPVEGAEILVVEGWMADGALERVVEMLGENPRYRYVCTTGIVIERGFYLSDIKDYATLCALSLEKMGVDPERLIVCPTPPVQRNRTYESAVALRERLESLGLVGKAGDSGMGLDVVSIGPHARRTRLNFRHAFGDGLAVGVISVDGDGYDSARWWSTSAGVKVVLMETMALFFEWCEGTDPGED